MKKVKNVAEGEKLIDVIEHNISENSSCVIILTGILEDSKDFKPFKKLVNIFNRNKFNVKLVQVNYNNNKIDTKLDFVENVTDELHRVIPENSDNIIFGFGLGSVFALNYFKKYSTSSQKIITCNSWSKNTIDSLNYLDKSYDTWLIQNNDELQKIEFNENEKTRNIFHLKKLMNLSKLNMLRQLQGSLDFLSMWGDLEGYMLQLENEKHYINEMKNIRIINCRKRIVFENSYIFPWLEDEDEFLNKFYEYLNSKCPIKESESVSNKINLN